MFLDQTKINAVNLDPAVFSSMKGMKFLKIYDSSVDENDASYVNRDIKCPANKVYFRGGLESLPDELRCLVWHFCPLKALPSNFEFEKLVEINMFGSNVERLWSGAPALPHLKDICMAECRFFIEMPDFSGASNFESIRCAGCISLLEVSPSIQCLNKLCHLDLIGCKEIMTLPSTRNLRSLERLFISGCKKISKFPEVPTTIEQLSLEQTGIQDIPSSIGSLSQLRILNIRDCNRIKNIPNVFFQLEHLETLAISGPYVIAFLVVNDLSCLSSLQELFLIGNDFESIPSSIKQLPLLRELTLSYCRRLQSLPKLPPGLRYLNASHCKSLQAVSSMMELTEERSGHFYFIHCTSLDWEDFRIHVPRRIIDLAYKTLESHRDFDNGEKNQYAIIFPGDSIPNWIQHQKIGLSIILPLPPNWYKNFLGFALSAVLRIGKMTRGRNFVRKYMRLECQLKCKSGESYPINAGLSFYEYNYQYITTSSWNQVLIFYNSDFYLKVRDKGERMVDYNEVSFGFFMEDDDNNGISPRVQECGVRLLYHGNHNYVHDENEAFNFHQDRAHSSGKHKVESNVVRRRKRKCMMFSLTMMRLKPMKYLSLSKRKRMRKKQGAHLALKKRKRGSK